MGSPASLFVAGLVSAQRVLDNANRVLNRALQLIHLAFGFGLTVAGMIPARKPGHEKAGGLALSR